jgi:hypothetical protein
MAEEVKDEVARKESGTMTAFDRHLERCLSMIMHHDEVRQIADVIKRVKSERMVQEGG